MFGTYRHIVSAYELEGILPSMAGAYVEKHRRLSIVACSLTSAARAWRKLDHVAEQCTIRVLLPPALRASPSAVVSSHLAWRFSDGSHVVLVVTEKVRGLEVLDQNGIGNRMMCDSIDAFRTALSAPGNGLLAALAEAWLITNGVLPPLDAALLADALQSPSRVVREAAIGGLSRVLAPEIS